MIIHVRRILSTINYIFPYGISWQLQMNYWVKDLKGDRIRSRNRFDVSCLLWTTRNAWFVV